MIVNSASQMKEHLEKTGHFSKVLATKNKDDGFVFECYYDELSSSQEGNLRSTLEEYDPSISHKVDTHGNQYLKIIISSGLINNL